MFCGKGISNRFAALKFNRFFEISGISAGNIVTTMLDAEDFYDEIRTLEITTSA